MRRIALLAVLLACKPAPSAPPDAGVVDTSDSRALLAEVDRLKDQLKDKPKTFEILSALGNLYYDNGRYLEAVDTFRQAEDLAAPAEAEADALRKRGVKPAADLPSECRRSGAEYGLVQIEEVAKKLDPPRRLRCLDAALEMALAVRSRRGNSFYLIGNPEAALAEHRKVLERSPDYPESLFFVGAILLEQQQIAEGKKYWQRLLKVAPDSPRAPLVRDTLPKAEEVFKPRAAGQLPPGHPQVAQNGENLPPGHPPIGGNQPGSPMQHSDEPSPQEVQNMQEAVQNTERTPDLEKGLDALLAEGEQDLDQGKYQDARDTLVRVMPMRPNDARTAAAMGGAMRGLGRVEMAERTLSHALQLDPKQPRALYEMGKLKAQQGDRAAALASFKALQAADPKFARGHAVDAEIAKLR
ncbi:MAG: tetratricopeptide repeat protein [Myxococcales bacterium]|nr:tetratricopeptide repeat protein [Myxococcales bacterium]